MKEERSKLEEEKNALLDYVEEAVRKQEAMQQDIESKAKGIQELQSRREELEAENERLANDREAAVEENEQLRSQLQGTHHELE